VSRLDDGIGEAVQIEAISKPRLASTSDHQPWMRHEPIIFHNCLGYSQARTLVLNWAAVVRYCMVSGLDVTGFGGTGSGWRPELDETRDLSGSDSRIHIQGRYQ